MILRYIVIDERLRRLRFPNENSKKLEEKNVQVPGENTKNIICQNMIAMAKY